MGLHHPRELRAGGELIVRATQDGMLKLTDQRDFTPEHDTRFAELLRDTVRPVMAAAVMTPQSRLVGQSLKQIGFFERCRGIVLAVYGRDRERPVRIVTLDLREGEVLPGRAGRTTSLRSGRSVAAGCPASRT